MKKSRISIVLVTLIVSSMVLFGMVNFSTAQSGTNISGIIASDTTWNQANSPYTLTGNVLVNNGVTLTIQAGTIVNLGSYYIEVNGTLQAIGNSANLITFNGGQITFTQYSTNWTESTGTGCIIQNATIRSAITLGNSTKINYGIVYGAIVDSNSLFGTTGVQSIISNNTIMGGIHVVGNETISNNVILNQGVEPWGNATVINNIVSGCSAGITTYDYPNLVGNLIVNNTVGIVVNNWGSVQCPIIQNNTLTNNTVGISFPEYWAGIPFSPSIFYNNIYANTNYNINSAVPNNINATYNWWGTTDTQAISQTIYDYYDNFNVGVVTYSPLLTAPNTKAPTGIIASAGAGGSINPSGVVNVNYGSSQSFTITPNAGFYIVAVSVNGTSVGAVSSYTVQNIAGATTLSATFAPNPTPSPTPSPTLTSSPTPTAIPTTSPTSNPTSSPTSSPSPTPTPTVPEIPYCIVGVVGLMIALLLVSALTIHFKNFWGWFLNLLKRTLPRAEGAKGVSPLFFKCNLRAFPLR